MFEEASYFAAIETADDGSVNVALGSDHPGVADLNYRKRRNDIAALALSYELGDPIPYAQYTPEEHGVWATVQRALQPLHAAHAPREFLDGVARLSLPTDRIPQLEEVSDKLAPLTGFRYYPAAGLVPLRSFYSVLDEARFFSTQYIRHHSVPLYTPEPDVIHEVVGHANALANDSYARLYRAAGAAAKQVETDAALEFVSKVFWFSLEFGVCFEGNDLKAYGAGILSSFGELGEYAHQDIRPLDIAAMGTLTYDITHYQPVLFAGATFAEVEDTVGGFFETVDDDVVLRVSA